MDFYGTAVTGNAGSLASLAGLRYLNLPDTGVTGWPPEAASGGSPCAAFEAPAHSELRCSNNDEEDLDCAACEGGRAGTAGLPCPGGCYCIALCLEPGYSEPPGDRQFAVQCRAGVWHGESRDATTHGYVACVAVDRSPCTAFTAPAHSELRCSNSEEENLECSDCEGGGGWRHWNALPGRLLLRRSLLGARLPRAARGRPALCRALPGRRVARRGRQCNDISRRRCNQAICGMHRRGRMRVRPMWSRRQLRDGA